MPIRRDARATIPHLLLLAAAVVRCGTVPVETVPVENDPCALSVVLGDDSVMLRQGTTQQLAPTLLCDADPRSGVSFLYHSSDTTTVTVSAAGLLTARAGGRATVTATSESVSATMSAIVVGHPAGVLALSRMLPGRPIGVAISEAGVVLVTRYDSATLGRFRLPDLAPAPGPAVPTTGLDVAFTPGGRYAFITNRDQQQLTVVDVAANADIGSVAVDGHPLRVLADPGGTLYVTTDRDSLFKVNPVTRTIIGRTHLATEIDGSGMNGLALSPDGALLHVSHQSGHLTAVTTASLAVADSFSFFTGMVEAVAASPTGDTLYVATAGPGGLYLWDWAAHQFLTWVQLPGQPYDVKITPDGTRIFVTTGARIFIIDREALVVTDSLTLSPGPAPARRLAFDRYGRFAVVADENGLVHLIR